MDDKKNIYITLHKNFVHEGIEYEDRKTGETKTFNSVTLPKGTVVNGQDVSYSQFSPLFVNPSRFKGENYRDIPLLAEKEVWLKKSVLEPVGSPTLDEDGKQVREVIKVMPAALKEGIDKGRAAYLASLDDKAKEAVRHRPTRAARFARPSPSPDRRCDMEVTMIGASGSKILRCLLAALVALSSVIGAPAASGKAHSPQRPLH